LRYIFAAPTVPQEPTPNTLQTNNVDPSLVTEIYFSTTAYPNRSVSNILELLDQGDALYIQQSSSDDSFINANISGAAVDNGSYFTVPIQIVSAGTPFPINSFTNIIVYHAGGGGGSGNVPNGGEARQVLEKNSSTDGDFSWKSRFSDYLINVEYTGVETSIASGTVLTAEIGGSNVYRFIDSTLNANGYPQEDAFYLNFDGTNLSDLIIGRG
jgi:hypothetical protein